MRDSKPWSRRKLTQMLYHSFVGTLADNAIEIGWVLCFSLIADKGLVERITTLFGVNDAFWVILSSTYYTASTSLTSRLPKLVELHGEGEASKQFKNHIYLFYMMLIPASIGSFMFMPKLLQILGVSQVNIPLYLPYFRLSVLAILVAAPWSVMVPSYLRTRGLSREATMLDHAVAWSMLGGIFFTTHVLNRGILWALLVNIITNAIPFYWFIWKKPIKGFWFNGFEFSWSSIKESWSIVKWELVRKLAPRVSAIIGVSLMITVNPIYLAVKYWVSNLAMFPNGWVDAMAGLLNSHVSKNSGLGLSKPEEDNEYVFRKTVFGLISSILVIYLGAVFFLKFLPESIYGGVVNPLIYIFLVIEMATKLRYYMWLPVSRSHRQDLNGVAQLFYAVPTVALTPILLWVFLHNYNLGISGIFLTGAIVGTVQWLPTEAYFRRNIKTT